MQRRDFFKLTLPLTFASRALASPSFEPVLSFGVIADPQYADAEPIATRFYRESLRKLEDAISDLNSRPLDFTITLGDLIDLDFVSFAPVMERYAKLASPHFPILGNHDFSVSDADKGKVLKALGMEKAYYSKIIKGWRFVFLDGTDTAVWRWAQNDLRSSKAKSTLDAMAAKLGRRRNAGDTAVGADQRAWLEEELTAARQAEQSVILFNHYPVFPHVPPNLLDAPDLVSLIERFPNTVAWMNGHNHRGSYAQKNHCHYVNFKGMVETEQQTAYAIVQCFSDRIVIEGRGLEPMRNLPR
jgi:3',5'-cyclic AMP phosphodiesterase CpdA